MRPGETKVAEYEEGQAGLQQQLHGVRRELLSEIKRVEQIQEGRHKENSARLDDMDHVLNGNGQQGLVRIVTDFVADSRARDDERKKQVAAQQESVKAALEAHNVAQTLRDNEKSAAEIKRDNRRNLLIAIGMLIIALIGLFKH